MSERPLAPVAPSRPVEQLQRATPETFGQQNPNQMIPLNKLPESDRVVGEGHLYELENFEDKSTPGQVLKFIEKSPVDGDPSKLQTVMDGTTNEELLRVLIHRMGCLAKKFPCRENAIAVTKLDEALLWLEKRTRDRVARNVEGKHLA